MMHQWAGRQGGSTLSINPRRMGPLLHTQAESLTGPASDPLVCPGTALLC